MSRAPVQTNRRGGRHAPALALCAASIALGAALAGCDGAPTDFIDLDPVVLVETARAADWPADAKTIVSHRIDGDSLFLNVTYSGGCETHVFRLIVSSVFAESFPVQTWGILAHDGRNDPCDAIVAETLAFDLTPLREAYRSAYGAGPGELVLHIEGLAAAVRYAF